MKETLTSGKREYAQWGKWENTDNGVVNTMLSIDKRRIFDPCMISMPLVYTSNSSYWAW